MIMKTKIRTKSFLALLLTLVMLFSVMSPVTSLAAGLDVDLSFLGSNTKLTSKTDYNVAPGVTESHIITHNKDGSNQIKSFALEVDLSNPNVGILASYNNYMDNLAGTPVWGMQTVRDQAVAAEKYYQQADPNFQIVGGVNGDFFNMSTGAPTGTLVMNGKTYNTNNSWNYFAILDDGSAVIGSGAAPANAKEVVGGPAIILKDGVIDATSGYGVDQLPRTAVGIKADGTVVFVVADGRQAPDSCGQTFQELAEEMKALGCVDALSLDGGGSATMVSQHEGENALACINSPSDGTERTVSTAILIYSNAAPDGQFDHAVLTPNNEIYTPGSTVELAAKGVDSSGAAADLPADGVFTLKDDSFGTIEGNVFTSTGKTGTVTVEYVVNGFAKGSTTFEIQAPDYIGFTNTEVSLGFEAQTDFGVQVKYNDKKVNYKIGDIVWSMSDPTMGSFSGNTFTSSDSASVTGIVTATSAFDENVKGEITAVIGKLPSIIWDFENPEDYVFGTGVYEASGGTITSYESDYVPGTTTMIKGSYGRGATSVATVVNADEGKVRFDSYALKFDYDLTNVGAVTEGACIGGVSATESTEGTPTAVGMWLYAPEGTPNLWVRMRFRDGNGSVQTVNFTENYAQFADTGNNTYTGIGGINWTGWKYLEADLSNFVAPFSFFAGETIRLMILNNSSGHYTYTGPAEGTNAAGVPLSSYKYLPQADRKGTVYIDNVQFVYGANTDDVNNPVINSIKVGNADRSDMVNIGADTVVANNDMLIQASFADFEDKYATGINYDACRLYIDGKDVTADTQLVDGEFNYISKLANGIHSVKLVVRDKFNNETAETRYFTVNGTQNLPTVKVEAGSASCVLNDQFTMNVVSNAADKITSVTTEIQLDADIVKDASALTIEGAEGFTVSSEYNNGLLKLTITKEVATVSEDAEATSFAPIATIKAAIPHNVAKGKNFSFRVLQGAITFNDAECVTDTFAASTVEIPVAETYTVYADPVIVDNYGVFHVTDADGNPAAGITVYNAADNTAIGTTNKNGIFRYAGFSNAVQSFTVYAMNDGKYSFKYTSQSLTAACNEDGKPEYVHLNASADGNTEKNISWLSNPIFADDKAYVQYATKAEYEANGAAAFTKKEGTAALQTFLGSTDVTQNYVANINTVNISGLAENTEYVYRVGDGKVWSDVKAFSTPVANADTKFFIFGDIQAQDTTKVSNLLGAVAADEKDYAFGIQTGDAVEVGSMYPDWADILNVFADDNIVDTDMLHVLGNHEYMGDPEADAASGIFNTANKKYYSVEYGNVYVAVINYDLNSSAYIEEACNWLKADAAASDATWKFVALHTPPYGTNILDEQANWQTMLPPVAEEAGIDFVFSGHDHSYARTEPMVGGQVDENGVVYFISGSSGEKSYGVTVNPDYNFAMATNEYSGIYISVSTTDTTATVTVYDVTSADSKVIFDSYTKTIKTDCSADGHDFAHNDGYLTCSVCGYVKSTENFTGNVKDAETGLPIIIENGELVKNKWVDMNNAIYYLGEDGIPATGTAKIGNYEYPFDAEGKLTKVAFVKEDGTLATNIWLGEDYYLGEDGLAVTGERKIDKYTYTFGEDGKLTKGALVKEGKYYYYYIAGTKQRNWKLIDGNWHYFDVIGPSGPGGIPSFAMATGKYPISRDGSAMNLVYTFDANGRLIGGALTNTDYGKVLYWANNERLTGWYYVDEAIYFFGENYYAVTGSQTIDGTEYTFDAEGRLQLKDENFAIDGTFYYFDEDGKILTNHIADHPYVKVVDKAVEPQIGVTGLTEGEHCKTCGTVTVAQKTVAALPQPEPPVDDPEPPVDDPKPPVDDPEPPVDDPEPEVPYILGDATRDGEINAQDARFALRIAAGLEKVTDEKTFVVMDVNVDGKVNAIDARLILRYSAGIIKEFP